MNIQTDAGEILLYIYDCYVNDKDHVNPEMLLKTTNWAGDRIDRALQYLKDIDAIDLTFNLGDMKGLRNFILESVTPIGTGIVENKPEFKRKFGFEVNIGLNPSLKFNWSVSEK